MMGLPAGLSGIPVLPGGASRENEDTARPPSPAPTQTRRDAGTLGTAPSEQSFAVLYKPPNPGDAADVQRSWGQAHPTL